MNPIIFTHVLVTTAPSKPSAAITGHYATIHLCAGPGDENHFVLLYGKVLPSGSKSPGIIMPVVGVRHLADTGHTEVSPVPMLGGKLLDGVAKLAGMAIDAVLKETKGSMRSGRQYRVSLTGEVQLLPKDKN